MYCPSCGAENLANIPRCEKCGVTLPPLPGAPAGGKTAGTTMERSVGGHAMARLGDRLIALFFDSVIGAVLFAVIGLYAAIHFGGLTESGFSLEGKPAVIGIAGSLVVGFLYYWILEGLFGATLGKAIIGIRVRDKSGGRCGLKGSLIRNLLRAIDGLGVYLVGFVVAALSKSRQRLGDHLGRTVVVEDPSGTLMRALFIVLWFALLGGGSWWAYMVHSTASPPAESPLSRTATGKLPPPPADGPSGKEASKPPVQVTGELSVVNFVFLETESGPARSQGPYKSGEKVRCKFDVTGFTADPEGRAQLLFDVVPLDPDGLRLYENWKGEFRGIPENPEAPVPVTFNFDLPGYSPAGLYTLKIQVHDAVKKSDAAISHGFKVEAPGLKPAAQLEIRDFQFSRSEGGRPEDRMVLEGGGRVHMAFHLAGMQFRDDRPDVEVAMRVAGPGGEVMLERADLVQLRDLFVYHPPTFSKQITSWVTLPSGVPKGVYTASFTVNDRIAQKKIIHEGRFEVR
jgi:uncharacterized RDD family membrane protein YckC